MTEFNWTDEKVLEFLEFTLSKSPVFQGRQSDLEQFKNSQTTEKQAKNWEVLSSTTGLQIGGEIIHMVRRLSDGIEFCVGEKINTTSDGESTIRGFFIRGNNLEVKLENGSINFEHIHKLKQPIIVSKDGVDLFLGDSCYYVACPFGDKDTPLIVEYTVRLSNINAYFFSTREAAEQYVLLNRKIFSINDLLNGIEYVDKEREKELLIKLAQKILSKNQTE